MYKKCSSTSARPGYVSLIQDSQFKEWEQSDVDPQKFKRTVISP